VNIHRSYRRRMSVVATLGAAAIAIAAAGIFSDRMFLFPAAMMAVSAATCLFLARSSYRFDLGLTGPPEHRKLVREARASWAEDDQPPPEEVAAVVPPDTEPSETR